LEKTKVFEVLKDRLLPMRLKGRRDVHHVEVVKCAVFATPNSLKSHASRKSFSPANAVAAALASLAVEPRELPLSPPRVWQLIKAGVANSE
jgi:hypothetical protein